MRYVGGIDETGKTIDVRDPLADRLRTASLQSDDPAGKVAALLSVKEIFDDLGDNAPFVAAVTKAYETLAKYGAKSTVEKFVS